VATPRAATPGQPSAAAATPGPAASSAASTPAPVTGTTDVCGLLTASDLDAATGKQYGPVTNDSTGQCIWNTEGSSANTGDVIILYTQPLDLSFVKSSFGQGGSDATVAGHAAFWNPSQGLGSLWVDIGGGNLLIISQPKSDTLTSAEQQIAQQLAEKAVNNL